MNTVSRWVTSLALLSFFAVAGLGCRVSEKALAEGPFEFALMGDNPYVPGDVPKFETLIKEVNQSTDLAWVLHVGDIRGIRGSDTVGCSDEVFRARFDLFQRFQAPFIFTPGDNDWLDCRLPAAGGYDEYERLKYLRGLFFPSPGLTTGGHPMQVATQSREAGFEEFVENAMWIRGGVVFSTVHLVGLTQPTKDPAADSRRMDAALSWIAKTFQRARESNSRGVFVATQADPWIVSGLPILIRRTCPDCLQPRAGLERLYPVLEKESLAFSRPVVLAVGDTHVFRMDKPLYSPGTGLLVENFTRIEPFGYPYVHWVRVRVDTQGDRVFSFQEQIVEGNVVVHPTP